MEILLLEILAEKAYKAYHEYLDIHVSSGYFGTEKSSKFDEASDETRRAWMAAVKEVIASYPQMEE